MVINLHAAHMRKRVRAAMGVNRRESEDGMERIITRNGDYLYTKEGIY